MNKISAKNMNMPMVKVLLAFFFMAVFSSATGWVITPSGDNANAVLFLSILASLFYMVSFVWLTKLGNIKKLTLNRFLAVNILSGGVVMTQFFWGGGMYLLVEKPFLFGAIVATYTPLTIILARKKFTEVNLRGMLEFAIKNNNNHIHELNFSVDSLPRSMPSDIRNKLHACVIYPILGCLVIALCFARSDWKYTIAAPFAGAGMLAMTCVMLYGNIVSLFCWIHYKKNQDEYSEFEYWPRQIK